MYCSCFLKLYRLRVSSRFLLNDTFCSHFDVESSDYCWINARCHHIVLCGNVLGDVNYIVVLHCMIRCVGALCVFRSVPNVFFLSGVKWSSGFCNVEPRAIFGGYIFYISGYLYELCHNSYESPKYRLRQSNKPTVYKRYPTRNALRSTLEKRDDHLTYIVIDIFVF